MKLGECRLKTYGKIHDVIIVKTKYYDDNMAIAVMSKNGEPWGTLSVNLPKESKMLGEKEFFVKTWSENEPWVWQVLEQLPDVFEHTGGWIRIGYVDAAIWRLK